MNLDWLEEATRAARDVGVGDAAEAARTRQRILRSLGSESPARRRRAPWMAFAAAALLASSAWAAGEFHPRLVAWLNRIEAVRAVAPIVPSGDPSIGPGPREATLALEPERIMTHDAVATGPQGASSAPAMPAVPALPPASLPARRSERGADAPSYDPPEPSVDPIALYTEAHELHFRVHDPALALQAWDRYLRVAPADVRAGLVLEARYNRAICLLRLGRREEARAALRPFAEGIWGGYRRDDARALLDENEEPENERKE